MGGMLFKRGFAASLRGFFKILSLVSMLRISDMRDFCRQKLIWIGPILGNVSLRVISAVAKFHAFIINLNNLFDNR